MASSPSRAAPHQPGGPVRTGGMASEGDRARPRRPLHLRAGFFCRERFECRRGDASSPQHTVTLEDDTEINYKCTDFYAPDCDGAVAWDTCGIDWPLEGDPVISEKDAKAQSFDAFNTPFTWEGTP